jgi:hypothetical protein
MNIYLGTLAIEFNDVVEVGDCGSKKKAPAVNNYSNWKTQLVAIEKERVDVLRDIGIKDKDKHVVK